MMITTSSFDILEIVILRVRVRACTAWQDGHADSSPVSPGEVPDQRSGVDNGFATGYFRTPQLARFSTLPAGSRAAAGCFRTPPLTVSPASPGLYPYLGPEGLLWLRMLHTRARRPQ